jgi:hypothetical protein
MSHGCSLGSPLKHDGEPFPSGYLTVDPDGRLEVNCSSCPDFRMTVACKCEAGLVWEPHSSQTPMTDVPCRDGGREHDYEGRVCRGCGDVLSAGRHGVYGPYGKLGS